MAKVKSKRMGAKQKYEKFVELVDKEETDGSVFMKQLNETKKGIQALCYQYYMENKKDPGLVFTKGGRGREVSMERSVKKNGVLIPLSILSEYGYEEGDKLEVGKELKITKK